MAILVLASPEVVAAFGLGGIWGKPIHTRSDLLEALESVRHQGQVKLLVIEQEVADLAPEVIESMKLDHRAPLIVEVAGPAGPAPGRLTARDRVRQALGIRL